MKITGTSQELPWISFEPVPHDISNASDDRYNIMRSITIKAYPHLLSFCRFLPIDLFDLIKWQKLNDICHATCACKFAWRSFNLTSQNQLKNVPIHRNRVISSIYIHTQSHTIRRVSRLPLIKTDNKLDMINVSIDKHWQK